MLFQNRTEAGQRLAEQLKSFANRSDVIVLGLPRGGVPVAFEIAKKLNVALDVLLVRKLGFPGQEELAMGAIASGGVRVLNSDVVESGKISADILEKATEKQQQEIKRREQLYRSNLPPLDVGDRTVIVVDDGLATGATMRVAVQALKQQSPHEIIVAVPLAAAQIRDQLRAEVNLMICLETPDPFLAVGLWYRDFSQTTDEEVRTLLQRSSQLQASFTT